MICLKFKTLPLPDDLSRFEFRPLIDPRQTIVTTPFGRTNGPYDNIAARYAVVCASTLTRGRTDPNGAIRLRSVSVWPVAVGTTAVAGFAVCGFRTVRNDSHADRSVIGPGTIGPSVFNRVSRSIITRLVHTAVTVDGSFRTERRASINRSATSSRIPRGNRPVGVETFCRETAYLWNRLHGFVTRPRKTPWRRSRPPP